MDQLPPLGKSIQEIVFPTFKIYDPLLRQNADAINVVKKDVQEHQYGPLPRQKLDVYPSAKPSIINGRRPVLMWIYGGGLVNGHKRLPGLADDLCYANIASFFSQKCGYSVVCPDYRLVNSHDAKFPSGGEDISLAVEWIRENAGTFGPEPIDLFIMGNSAGGVHLSTFLLHAPFAETRGKVLRGNGMRLRGVILLSVPFSFDLAHWSRGDIMTTYFGDVDANAPLGLLKSAQKQGKLDFVEAGIRAFVLNGELDPEDEILKPRDDFLKQWITGSGNEDRGALAVDWQPGHNHISPSVSLGTGIEREEAWGYQVGSFCDNIRKFAPS